MTASRSQERLDALARLINAEHDHFRRVGRRALEHAIRAGDALVEAQAQVPKGGWLAWISENVAVHPATVYKYMRLSRLGRERVLGSGATGVEDALRIFSDEPWHNRTVPSEEDKRRMAALVEAEGLKAVAEAFDVVPSTVWRWTSPNSPVAITDRRSSLAKRGRAPHHALIEITDAMIDATAAWLCQRFADTGYFATVNDQVRGDALELLGVALSADETRELKATA